MTLHKPGRASGVFFSLLALACLPAFGDEPKARSRTPWTTSRIKGTPEAPPPYKIEPAFPNLKFDHPVALVSVKGSDRLFMAEQAGKIHSFPNDPNCGKTDLVLDLGKVRPGMSAFYGLTFHPDFEKNRQVFVSYVMKDGSPDGTRVSRFTMLPTEPPRIDPDSETIILTFPGGGHNGACLAFGHDRYLYISTGDGEGPAPPDVRMTGQDVSDLLSSILRIDVDHADGAKPYRVPEDNPFVKRAGARPEIWAFGFRNPWKMTFDRANGDLWVGDVGWELWELVFKVERGGNYGWSVVEGRQPVHTEGRRGPGPILPPTVDHPHSEAASITGGYVYRGNRQKELAGIYIYGDFQTGRVWGLKHDGKKVTGHKVLADTPLQLVAFAEDNSGELYLVDYERTRQVHKLVPNPAAKAVVDFPKKLSETGLFSSTNDRKPSPGVIPYAINAALWSDNAEGERFAAIPGDAKIEIDPKGNWRVPEGSVLAKTVSIETDRVEHKSRRRLETQILHFEDGSFRPYTYVWDADQADATLADADGSSLAIEIREAGGKKRTQTHRVHARTECQLCHNPWVGAQTTVFGRQSASPLGFEASQLDREHSDGGSQLRSLESIGLFSGKVPAVTSKLANPYDSKADLETRARSYLQVNCAHCHMFNAGGAANIFLGRNLPLEQTKTVGVRPIQGAFGISGASIISPGDPEGSVLYYRIAKLGGGRMPRVGSQMVDERALDLFHAWISGLPHEKTPVRPDSGYFETVRRNPSADFQKETIRSLLGTTRGALSLMRMVGQDLNDSPLRGKAIEMAQQSANVEVRDLFERFVPESERVKRLGDVVNVAALLSLKGDAARGKEVFAAGTSSQCKSCHKINTVGESIGPDLSKIGGKYDRAAILQQILNPSQTIDPQYLTYLLETKSGKIHTGVIVEKNDRAVVLKDARNQTVRVETGEVEILAPQPKSLMPELLLKDMTPGQVADLLEYLGSLK